MGMKQIISLLNLLSCVEKDDRGILYKNYYAHAETEDLFKAQDLFRIIIASMDFKTDIEIALGATAVDKDL